MPYIPYTPRYTMVMREVYSFRQLFFGNKVSISLREIIDICQSKLNIRVMNYTIYELYYGSEAINELEKASDLALTAFEKSFVGGTKYTIVYNEDPKNNSSISFNILHELGHILLGHDRSVKAYEIEADYFARQILCPVWLSFAIPREEKTKIFNVSTHIAHMATEMRHKDYRSYLNVIGVLDKNSVSLF